jgi:glycosyltransferase involved in cell wall biosynthesis
LPVGNTFKAQPETRELQEKGIEVFFDKYADIYSHISSRPDAYQAIIISRPHVFEKLFNLIQQSFPNAAIIYDAEALFFTREKLKSQLKKNDTKVDIDAMANQEMKLLEKADMVISVSPKEANLMLQNSNQNNITVWGHIQDINTMSNPFSRRRDILFLGSFFAGPGSPNEDAAIYFATEIFPLVLEQITCKLYIVGSHPTSSVLALSSELIAVTGYVEKLEDYFNNCRVNVVPTRFAAGIPLKLIQAMGHGIPSVVSDLIASQLGLIDNEQVLIGKKPQDFARKIFLAYTQESTWNSISQNSVKFIENNFSRDTMTKNIDEIVKQSINIHVSKKLQKNP